MPIAARRTARAAGAVALALTISYSSGFPIPYLAPFLAFNLAASGAPPPGLKALIALTIAAGATLGIGLVMIPMLLNYPISAVLIILVGLYLSSIVSLKIGQEQIGLTLAIGFTMIPAQGMVSYDLGVIAIQGTLLALSVAVVAHWIIYPLFPEDQNSTQVQANKAPAADMHWIAVRSSLIVIVPVMFAFTNPSLFFATILKSLMLAQQSSQLDARAARRELLSSNFAAGCCAIALWLLLQISPNIWFFALWMLLFSGYCGAKLFGALPSLFSASFWLNVGVTVFLLLGPAVQDSANGSDVYSAFLLRFSLFVGVCLYALVAVVTLEKLRSYLSARRVRATQGLNTTRGF